MKTSGLVVLITGGGSGIGFETAKLFAARGNRVILTGRNKEKLEHAARQLENTVYFACDVNSEEQTTALAEFIKTKYGKLNVLMNNAGHAHLYQFGSGVEVYEKAKSEMETNYFSVIRLTEKLVPLMQKETEAAVINVSSIVAISPSLALSGYSASKAALHAYSLVLRLSLAQSSKIKVFEVMPPLVDTDFAKGIPSPDKISPAQVAEETLAAMENNTFEIHIASTKDFLGLFLNSPEKAFLAMNAAAVQQLN